MQRKLLSIITLALIAVFAQICYSVDRPPLLSEVEVNRYGLERTWYSQITIDGRLTKIEHTLLDRGTFFIITSHNDLIALNAETGQTLWSRRAGDLGLKSYAPAANARTVAVACNNEVQVFDRRNGRLLWHQVLPAAASAACQLTDSYLYIPLVDQRMACFPMEELKAPSPGLLALVPQYKAIGYTLDPYSGNVTKTSNQIVTTEEFVLSQKGENKPAPSQRLLALVPDYAKIGMVLDPYTGEVREADKAVVSWWQDNMIEINAPRKGKKELDDLLEEEVLRLSRKQRQERQAGLLGSDTEDFDSDNPDAPYFLKPHKNTPLVCYSFGTTMVQPVISFDSADFEVLTWFTDRGYLFFAHGGHTQDRAFALQHKIAVTPAISYRNETRTVRYEGSIARDIVYPPAIVQKNLEDDNSRFLTVVGSASGLVFAYDSRTRGTRWWQSVGSSIHCRITAVKDRIYVPCMDGNFYCLDSNNGNVLWRSPGIDSFIAASPDWLYVKNTSNELVAVNPQDGAQTSLFSLKAYQDVYYNQENDRIYLIAGSGLIQCLREMGREQPVRHTFLPEAYLEYRETDEERRRLTEMPEIANGIRHQPRQTPQAGTLRSTPELPAVTESTPFGSGDDTIDIATDRLFEDSFSFPTPRTTPEVEQPYRDDPFGGDGFDGFDF
jgi:outer membrane protein assembly factor BamB